MAIKWEAKAETDPMTIVSINAFIFTEQTPFFSYHSNILAKRT